MAWWAGLAVTLAAAPVVARAADTAALRRAGGALVAEPLVALAVVAAYLVAFVLRAVAWQRVLPSLPLGQALAGIHLALGGNHVLPLRLGEPLRVTSVVRRTRVGIAAATASTVTLRAADVAALGLLAAVVGPRLLLEVAGVWALGLLVLPALVVAAGLVWLVRLRRADAVAGRLASLRLPGPGVASLVLAAWLLEAPVVWAAARWAGAPIDPVDALVVTTLTVAAQTLAVAPGGFGTYEAAGTAALVAVGVDPATGLAVALTAHAVKTAYSLVAGGVALLVPAPGFVGRLRLPRRTPPAPAGVTPDHARDAPVVLFLPAHDEEDAVGDVVRRAPAEVHGHPVHVLVVDDGSSDATARVAAGAGAEVLSLPENRGLGAAVRAGLAAAVERGAVAVAFCDADGEYAPEELAVLVGPILAGEADYVLGSRFRGDIARMLPHRRAGNLVLTAILRFVSRRDVTDGQSGYRAFSAAAAAAAEVVHDYNYAQVLTLDLLAKGYRYHEVPISYTFRETGRSFVRLGRYLRRVVPAVWRELNPELAAR
ncbi:MAG: lysylphosphatidylglycerol synthase domain-containing protein [Actinomycetes bacterium]